MGIVRRVAVRGWAAVLLNATLLGGSTSCVMNWDVPRNDAALDDASMQGAQTHDATTADPPRSEDEAASGAAAGDMEEAGARSEAAMPAESVNDAAAANDAAIVNDAAIPKGCGDGVREGNEACDRGASNSDTVADACRTNCALPRCGDGVTDQGEECDDANQVWGDSCYECSRRHYFILNQPSSNSAGNDSITRVDRRGHSKIIVGPDPTLNGMREIEISRDGKVLYAVQANYSLMQNRVLFFDPLSGAQIGQVKLDVSALGYDGSPTAMTLGFNDLLYILVHDNKGSEAKLITVDPDTKMVRPIFTLGADFGMVDMTRDSVGTLYVSTGSEIRTIQPAYMIVSSLASPNAFGLTYDVATSTLWVSSASTPLTIARLSAAGERTPYATLKSSSLSGGAGILLEPNGVPLVTIVSPSKVVAVNADGSTTDVWTANLDQPSDLEVIDFTR